MSQDLFGNPDPPKKGGPGYLAYLQQLELPLGLKFESLSQNGFAPGVPTQFVENLWCRDAEGNLWHLVLDLRTGEKYLGERAKLNSSIAHYSPVDPSVTSPESCPKTGREPRADG